LRAAIATVAPLAADHFLGLGGGTWMSLAGFNAALADKGGPYHTRAATLGALTIAGAAAAPLGAIAASHPTIAIPLTFAVAVACCLARAYGSAGASVGGAVLVVYVISLAFPPATPAEALARAGYVIIGGLWAMLVALVLWPLRPDRPARLAVAEAYRAVADYADDLAAAVRTGRPPGPSRVRASMENARAALAGGRRGRPGRTDRGERLLILGEIADQLFGNLFGLSDVAETIPAEARRPPEQQALAAVLGALAASTRGIAAGIESETDPVPVTVEWDGAGLRAGSAVARPAPGSPAPLGSPSESMPATARDDDASAHYEHAAALLDRMAQYAALAAASTAGLNEGRPLGTLERPRETEDAEPRLPIFGPLRAVLARDSVILRYALRVGLVTTAAVLLTSALSLKRGYWITITAVIILQPYTGVTTQRALQRVLGTIVGGALTAALAALFHSPLAILALAFVFSALSVTLLPLNYAAFSVFLTPTFVLLAEANAGDWHLAGVRILNTVLGGALALAGSRLLWPTAESERLPAYLAGSFRAMHGYLDRVVALFHDRSDQAGRSLRAARRNVGLAILNADESFQRVLGEHRGPPEELAARMTLLTYARRFSASIAALALSRHSVDSASGDMLVPFAREVGGVLEDLARALEEGGVPAPLPPAIEQPPAIGADASPLLRGRLTRLQRQLRTLHDAVGRWGVEG
jgi:uncharacterized membrane protein YccC